MRLPSVQSVRLQRSQSDDPFGHPALDSPASASRSCSFSDLQAAHEHISRNGLRSPMRNRELRRTTESDLDGRTACDLQPRYKVVSETNREEFSDLGHLGLDPVYIRLLRGC